MLHSLAERERLIGLAYLAGWIALLAAVAASLWFGARLVWLLVPAESQNVTTAVSDPASPVAADRAAPVDVAALHLFGRSGVGLTLSPTANAPETSLDLRLMGTLVGDSDEAGMAIIADADNEALYALGDELPGDAKLHEIHPDRVILIHRGRYETLRLREDDEAPDRRRAASAGGRPGALAPAGTPALGGQDLQAMQRNARLDPARLAQQVRALPVIEDGQPIGFRLQAGRDAALVGKLGLRPTDVITAVNGIPLNDPARAFELLSQLNSQTRFSVELKRDGRPMTLDIDASQLTE